MKRISWLLGFLALCPAHAQTRAKNVVLFLGDAGGVSTLNAAGIYAHNRPQSLFIHGMPHIALSDTSAANSWVTDSAAGMTAIVTGRKTNNGMVSQLPPEEKGGPQGSPLKTILEYAEERGLSTGVITNMKVWDATPAACYAHFGTRKGTGEIFAQVFKPRFGDGVEILIGADKQGVIEALEKLGLNFERSLRDAKYAVFDKPEAIPADATRAVALYDGGDFEPQPVVRRTIEILSRNPRGFFLMVEWDMHTKDLQKGLDRVLVMDALIRQTAENASPDTLIIFAADHSYDIRMRSGSKARPFSLTSASGKSGSPVPPIRVEDGHTGEEIIVAAQGPGAERVRGFIPNTRIFQIMMAAYGWPETE